MADPLSATASVAGLLTLTIELLRIARKFTVNAKGSEKDITTFIKELTALSDVLNRLDRSVDTQRSFITSGTPGLLAIRSACEDKLQELLRRLNKAVEPFIRTPSSRTKVSRTATLLKWPFTKGDHEEAIDSLHRYVLIFSFALSVDGKYHTSFLFLNFGILRKSGSILVLMLISALLSKTSEDVKKIMDTQDATLSEIRRIFSTAKWAEFIPPVDEALNVTKKVLVILESMNLDSKLGKLDKDFQKLEVAASEQTELQVQRNAYLQDKERRRLLNEISTVSFENKQKEVFTLYHPGTGQWLLEHGSFESWKSGSGPPVLCCLGAPGVGKTVLASLVIDHLRREIKGKNINIAYIYCDHLNSSKQTPSIILSSILRQLLASSSILFPAVKNACLKLSARCIQNEGPTGISEQVSLISTICKASFKSYLVIDAVDEIPEFGEAREPRKEFTEALFSLKDSCRILITSRPHTNIATLSAQIPSSTIQIRAAEKDIVSYANSRIQSSTRLTAFVALDEALRSEIVETVQSKAKGVFLLAKFQLDRIWTAASIRQVREALKSLSENLQDVYADCILRIENQATDDKLLGMRVLSWIARAKRPLSEQELIHALSVRPGDSKFDAGGIPDISTVIGACAGLVHVQTEAVINTYQGPNVKFMRNVSFAHYTIGSFIQQFDFSNYLDGDSDVAETCLGYLALDDFEEASFIDSDYPFYHYAASQWLAHAADIGECINEDAVLKVSRRPYWLQYALMDTETLRNTVHEEIPLSWFVVAAAVHGAAHVLRILIQRGFAVNEPFLGFTPLLVAVCYNHVECIELLLNAGADVNVSVSGSWRRVGKRETRGTWGLTVFDSKSVLGTAAYAGNSEIVSLLIDAGAKLNHLPSPLISAIRGNQPVVAKQLLRAGCDPNVMSAYGTTPLIEARAIGSAEMVDLILKAGADPNMATPNDTPLHSAAISGQWYIVEQLLAGAANPNTNTLSTMTVLQQAAYEGRCDMVQKLVEAGGNVNLTFGTASWMHSWKPPLHLALEGRHFDTAEYLIQAGADVNILAGTPLYTALEWAAYLDHLGLVKKLLNAGADPNLGRESCPLLASASRFAKAENLGSPKSTAVIRELLDAGADPNAGEGRFRTKLMTMVNHNVCFGWWEKHDPAVIRLCLAQSTLEMR